MKNTLLLSLIFFANLAHAQKMSSKNAAADLNLTIKTIENVHYNPYFKTNKEDVKAFKDSVVSSWNKDSINPKEFLKAGLKLTALMSGGHTQFDWQFNAIYPQLMSELYVPFKATLSTGKIYISESLDSSLEIDNEIISINGVKSEVIYNELLSYKGGIKEFVESHGGQLFPLHLFFSDLVKAPYKIQLKDKVVNIEGVNVNTIVPFLQQQFSLPDYTFSVLENNVGFIEYNSCNDEEKFKLFLDSTFKEIKSKSIEHLVIDISKNSGGNSDLNIHLLSYLTNKKYRQFCGRYWKVSQEIKDQIVNDSLWYNVFPEDFLKKYLATETGSLIDDVDTTYYENTQISEPFYKGKFCFIIGPQTFSSANFLADAVSTFKIAKIFGQASGEFTNDFGEQIECKLPNTGVYLLIASTYDIGANGKKDYYHPIYPDVYSNNALEDAIKWLKD